MPVLPWWSILSVWSILHVHFSYALHPPPILSIVTWPHWKIVIHVKTRGISIVPTEHSYTSEEGLESIWRVQEVCEIVQLLSTRGSVPNCLGNGRLEKRGYGPPKCMEKLLHLLIVNDTQGTDLDRSTMCDSTELHPFHFVQDRGRETIGADLQCVWKFGFLGRLFKHVQGCSI